MRFAAALASLALILPPPAARAASAPPAQAQAAAQGLAGHKAGYLISLDNAKGGDIVDVVGTMGYEALDSCDGWATRQRLAMTLTNGDGQAIEMVSDYTTFESKDGLRLRFRMRQTTDGAVTSETEGTATLRRAGGPGEARYAKPKAARVDLPAGTVFPMAHTAAILAAAREGRKFVAMPLFDGTDEAGIEDSSAVIVDWRPPGPTSAKTDLAALKPLGSARVRLAFFDRKSSNITPSYEVGMRYWENGVSDDLQMDFGEFSVRARIKEFALVPRRC